MSIAAEEVPDSSELDQLLIGESAPMQELKNLLRQVAPSNASVFINGPSGSGKEVIARALHAQSTRRGAYVPVNCGAIPRELLESELFGHEKGSFTGAHAQRYGRFEEADGGSLFLDEIGDMPADMQVKLLRVLEERAVRRVGGRGQVSVDVRIISATHRDIDQAIDEHRFREDLFYRLAVFPIEVPGLAERREDVPLLVRHFCAARKGAPSACFSPDGMARLVAHDWPGNVRELRNVVERANILYPGRTVGAEQVEMLLMRRGRISVVERAALWEASDALPALDVPSPAPPKPVALDPNRPIDLKQVVSELEQRYIQEALDLASGVVADAARLLSLQRTTLIEKMRKYRLRVA